MEISISKANNNAIDVYKSQPKAPVKSNKHDIENVGNIGNGVLGSNEKGVQAIPEDLAKSIITEINKKISKNTTAQFSFHEKTNRVMIKILDSETNEVIKEIPPEKTLDMIAQILELVGLLVDDKR